MKGVKGSTPVYLDKNGERMYYCNICKSKRHHSNFWIKKTQAPSYCKKCYNKERHEESRAFKKTP